MVSTSEKLILDLLRLQQDCAERASGYFTRPGAVPNGSFIQLPPILPSIIEPSKWSWACIYDSMASLSLIGVAQSA